MIRQCASKAKTMIIGAPHGGHNAAEISFLDRTIYRIFAFGCWAPLQVVLVIHVCTVKKDFISILHALVHQEFEGFRVNYAVASVERTLYSCCLTLLLDFLSEIMGVAIYTKSVTTFHGIRLQRWAILITYFASKAFHRLCLGCCSEGRSQACRFKNFILIIHVRLDESLFVPTHEP